MLFAISVLLWLVDEIIFFGYTFTKPIDKDEEIKSNISINISLMLLGYISIVGEMVLIKNLFAHIKMHKYMSRLILITGFILLIINGWVLATTHNAQLDM